MSWFKAGRRAVIERTPVIMVRTLQGSARFGGVVFYAPESEVEWHIPAWLLRSLAFWVEIEGKWLRVVSATGQTGQIPAHEYSADLANLRQERPSMRAR